MKEYDVFSGASGRNINAPTTFELKVRVRRKKAKVTRDRTVNRFSGVNPKRIFGSITKSFEDILNNHEFIDRDDIKAFNKLKIQIRLPRGSYPGGSVNENKILRQLIRKAIVKRISDL